MKKLLLLITLLSFSFLLSGCYLDEISDQKYGVPSEEELAREQIWETYHNFDEIYLDENLYDTENIDWMEVFKQSPSFRRLLHEMGDYSFLISIFENTHQFNQGYYNVQLEYHDQSSGHSAGYEIPIFDSSTKYQTLYYEEFKMNINDIELHFETYDSDEIKITYGDTIHREYHSYDVELTFDFGNLSIKPVPLGYEILLNDDVFFVYDTEVFPDEE